MKAIKIAVAIMTILLVVGFAVVIYTISTRLSDGTLSKKTEEVEQSASIDPEVTNPAFDTYQVQVPAGCHLVDTKIDSNKILLRFDGDLARGCQKVELYSTEGKKLGGWNIIQSEEVSE